VNRWRVLLVYGLIATVVGGHLLDILFRRDRWPFSSYPMYSNAFRSTTLSGLLLSGVPDDETLPEMPFLLPPHIAPFGPARLGNALGRLNSGADRRDRLAAGLDDVLTRYEARRVAGLHDGPPLRSLRLYRAVWRLEPGAANADRPDRHELLFEYVRPTK
jgi:hypothetical protein